MNLQNIETVINDILTYLECYEKSPFDSNNELALYVRTELNIQLPEPELTAEDLLKEFLQHFERPQKKPVQLLEKAQAFIEGISSPSEVRAVLAKGSPKGTDRAINIASLYSIGFSIEAIAQDHNVTRERIRQILAKFVRQNSNKSLNQPKKD